MKNFDSLVSPLLTDQYELSTAYSYWKAGTHEKNATFDLFFRKAPFKGEFTIFGGLSEVIPFLEDFHFRDERLDIVKEVLPNCENGFYDWLSTVNASQIKVEAIPEGYVCFPRVPLMTVSGPLAVAQLLETPLLTLTNYPTLVGTNAARFRLAAGPDKELMEFGLRRAQGPDGGVTAAKYAYIGGFDSTSNVAASYLYDIPCGGTHPHSMVQSFIGLDDLGFKKDDRIKNTPVSEFISMVEYRRTELRGYGFTDNSRNEGELAAFIARAVSFPNEFMALVDTYNTLKSGVLNFLAVALALHYIGIKPIGVRLDSGDLAYLSKEIRKIFVAVANRYSIEYFRNLKIAASNEINEEVLWQLKLQEHEINSFGCGTHLVTCQAQPSLGAVYKLVSVGGRPVIKKSEESGKITIPERKRVYRLYDSGPICDLMTTTYEQVPIPRHEIICWHPFDAFKRTTISPNDVELLQKLVWEDGQSKNGHNWGLIESRNRASQYLRSLREDHKRPVNPTPYKVAVSPKLFEETQRLLAETA